MNRPYRAPPPHERAMGVPLAEPPIPAELVQLYYTIDSMRRPEQASVLQLIAAGSGEGTSTIARLLARTAAANRGESVLLLECGGGHGTCSIVEAFQAGQKLKEAATIRAHDGPYRLAPLSHLPNRMLDLPPDGGREIFAALRRSFDTIFLDSPAMQEAPEAAALARYCDGTILVVQAEAATIKAVEGLRRDIERVGGRIVGAVLNRERRHIPDWLYRRL